MTKEELLEALGNPAVLEKAAAVAAPVEPATTTEPAAGAAEVEKLATEKIAEQMKVAGVMGRAVAQSFVSETIKLAQKLAMGGGEASHTAKPGGKEHEAKGTGGAGSDLAAKADAIGTTQTLPPDEAATKALKEQDAMAGRPGAVAGANNAKATNPTTSNAKLNLGAAA